MKVEHDFTDDRLTGFGGASALATMAKRMGLFRTLADAVSVKTRRRMGEFPAKVSKFDVDGLLGVVRSIATQVVPAVVAHEVAEKGFAH